MTAATRGTMRPNGRSPPFLAIGLFIALCVMGFNYWNLSAKNAEQANEISIINAEKLTARSTADKRIDSLSKQIESLQRDVTIARTAKETETSRLVDEKKNMQEKCEEDMRSLGRELEQCRELSNELKRKVESFSCGEEQCQSLSATAREKAFRDVYQAAGVSPLLTMHQKGVDLGRLSDELNEEFNLEIERQRQLAQLQQAGQNPNLVVNQQSVQNQQPQQPNQAGQQQPNQAGEQQSNQAGEQQLNQAGEQQQLQANQQPGDQGNQQVGPPAPQDQIKADDADNVPVNAKDEVGQDNDAEDNKLPSDDNNDKKADDDIDAQDYEYEEDEDEDQYDDENDDVDKVDIVADDNKIDETRKEMEMGPA